MAKFKLRGPDGGTYAITADTPEAAHAALYGTQAVEAPKSEPPVVQDNQQQTEELPFYTKAAKALAFGAAQTRSKDVDTLRKSGALGMDLDRLDQNTAWLKQQAGLQNYDPASAHLADSSKPWTERLGYLPRALLEGTPEMAQHIAASTVGGPLGMLASTAVAEGGSAVNRVREADKTDPNAELTMGQKARVGGNVALQALLNEVGAKATLGAATPVKEVGMAGVKQAAGNLGKTVATDAAVGGLGAATDKALIEQQAPSVADVALPALAGAGLGAAFRAPGAASDAAVATRFRSLGELEPQSRGQVADILQRYNGDFKATEKHVLDDLKVATKGMDEATRDTISKAKIQHEAGQRIDPQQIEAVSRVDPDAGRTLRNLDTLGVMRGLDNGGLSGSFVGRLLNPYQRPAHGDPATTLGKLAEGAAIGHGLWAVDPTTTAGVFGTQIAGSLGLKGIDKMTGAANPAKVITDRYAGTADPMPTIAEARAAAFAKDLSGRQAKVGAAKAELDAAKAESITTKLEGDIGSLATKRIKQLAKERKAESDALWKAAGDSVRDLNRLDDLRAKEERRVDTGIRQQTDIMRRSQAVEERRLANQQRLSDQQMARQANLMRNSQAVEQQRQSQILSDIGQQLRIMQASETASSSSAALPLAVAKLKAGFARDAEANAPAPEPTFNTDSMFWGPSSSIKGTPAEKAMMATRALERHNAKITKQEQSATRQKQKLEKEATQAKAEKRVKDAEAVLGKAKDDANPDLIFLEHRGQRVEQDADKVGSVSGWKRQTKKNIDDRMDVIDAAKSLTKDKAVIRLLDQLAKNWNSRSKNDPDTAYYHLEDAVNDSLMPAEIGKFLFDSWRGVRGTWRMKKGYEENFDE